MGQFVCVDTDEKFRALLERIFHDDFMRRHTQFQSFEGFRYSSAVFVNWNADQMIYDEEVFDNFVRESTEFSSWDEMVRTAVDACFGGKAKQE